MKKILFTAGLLAIAFIALLGHFVRKSERQAELITSMDRSTSNNESAIAPVIRLNLIDELDSFTTLLDAYSIESDDPSSLQELEEELANIGSLEHAENEYDEHWKDFVDSLDLPVSGKGQVKNVLIRSSAHNDELMQLFSADEISQEQVRDAWISETEVADALSNFLTPDQVQDYLNTYFGQVLTFAEDMLAWQSQEISNGEVGILDASGRNDLALVRAYVDAGVNLDMLPLDGSETPLLNAVGHENVEMARLLLANGADPNLATSDELLVTPLDAAASIGNIDMIRLLVEAGADFEQPSGGWLPLETAAFRGRTDAVAELLVLGADASGEAGSQALSWAIKYDDRIMEQMLIGAGAKETGATESARLAQDARRLEGI